ncbi:g5136 [Coccomyxa viridis]|uniref:G5136 protein n=1 Tax=Coccomyxa viridis TaxID=1274662 RepID=A0ABP1FS22_9CHLO
MATAIIGTNADANSFFTSLGDTFKNAGQTIAQGTQSAYGIVKNETIDAAQTTGGAFQQAGQTIAGTAKDVYGKTVQFAREEWNGTVRAINTVGDALQNVTVNFKTDALNEMRPAWENVQRAADSFADSTVTVADKSTNGVLYFSNETWNSLQAAGAPALAPMAAPKEGVDTTNPESLAAAVTSNSITQYADAARSILVAISANRSAQVSGAVGANVLAAYAQNNTQVPLGISESFSTAMLAADRAYANHTGDVTPTVVAQTLMEGLQAAVSNCTSTQQTTLQANSAAWYKFYAAQCCGPVTSTVGKMSLIMQQVPSDAVANAWFNELGNTYMGGAHPSFDLARCLAQDGDAVDLNVS